MKVKSTVLEVNDIISNIMLKNLDELKNLVRAEARLLCTIPTKNNLKNRTGNGEMKMILQDSGKI